MGEEARIDGSGSQVVKQLTNTSSSAGLSYFWTCPASLPTSSICTSTTRHTLLLPSFSHLLLNETTTTYTFSLQVFPVAAGAIQPNL